MASTSEQTRKSQIPKPAKPQTETSDSKRVVRKARKSYEGTTPGLSLQGPFNPNVLAAISAKRGEEPKRKRDGSGTGKSSGSVPDSTDRQRKSGEKARSPASGDFLSVANPDVPCAKRNQIKEQQKCKVEYKTKPTTTFAAEDAGSHRFTAATTSTVNKERGRTERPKHTSTKGYRELQKSEELLQKKVATLEIKVKGLEQFQKKSSQLEKENVLLEQRLAEEETSHKDRTEELESKIDSCMKKLEDCNIDPVTLEEDHSLDRQFLARTKAEAAKASEELEQNLTEFVSRSKDVLADIDNLIEDGGSVLS